MEDSAQRTTMLDLMARNWWVCLIRGIVSILFGFTAIIWPSLTLITLVWLFGFYAIFDGVASIWSGFTLIFPGSGALSLVFWIGSHAILSGILLITFAIRARRPDRDNRGSVSQSVST